MTMTAPTSAPNRTRSKTRRARPAEGELVEDTVAAPETEQSTAPGRTRRSRSTSSVDVLAPEAEQPTAPGRARVRTRPTRAAEEEAEGSSAPGRTRLRTRSTRGAEDTVLAPETERPDTRGRSRPAEPDDLDVGSPDTERPSGRPRTAAAQRAYARRAQREGRGPTRASREPVDTAAGRASFVVLIIALLVVGVAATLWLSTQAIADSYRLDEAKQTANNLSERAEVLQREVTKMDSPAAIAQRAKELGMVLPGDPARLVVQPDGTVVVVGEPKAAQGPAAPPPPPAEVEPAPPAADAQPPADGQTPPAQRAG